MVQLPRDRGALSWAHDPPPRAHESPTPIPGSTNPTLSAWYRSPDREASADFRVSRDGAVRPGARFPPPGPMGPRGARVPGEQKNQSLRGFWGSRAGTRGGSRKRPKNRSLMALTLMAQKARAQVSRGSRWRWKPRRNTLEMSKKGSQMRVPPVQCRWR